MARWREVLPFDSYEFYLCGPPAFMQMLYDGLTGLGVGADRIHYESFATGAALRVEPTPATAPSPGAAFDGSVAIRFAKSGVNVEWSRDKGTLLELAEAAGLAPAFGCRSGICGSCTTRVASGAVEYVEEPLATPGPGQILCAARSPRSMLGGAAASRLWSSICRRRRATVGRATVLSKLACKLAKLHAGPSTGVTEIVGEVAGQSLVHSGGVRAVGAGEPICGGSALRFGPRL
jgi:ferredoxin